MARGERKPRAPVLAPEKNNQTVAQKRSNLAARSLIK
jgi:hypothetical protein